MIKQSWLNWRRLIIDDRKLSFGAKSIALYLNTYMNDSHDMAFPSIARIRGELNIGSNSTVIKYIDELEKIGYLSREKRFNNSTVYHATIPKKIASITDSTPPTVLQNMEHSITESVTTVLQDLEPNKQMNNQSNKQTTGENRVSTQGVPINEIVKKWNEFAVSHHLPQTVKTTSQVSAQIRQRWKDDLPDLKNWDNYFDYIGKSDFLTGKTTPGNGRNKPFRATLTWITKEGNFAKIAAEEYH